jgi:hypothetical protein
MHPVAKALVLLAEACDALDRIAPCPVCKKERGHLLRVG